REVVVRVELPGADVEPVWPNPVLRVVGEVHAGRHRVPEVGSERVGGLRYSNAVPVVRAERRELGQNPPVRQLVMQDDRVARAVRAVRYSEALPQRAEVGRTEQLGAELVV